MGEKTGNMGEKTEKVEKPIKNSGKQQNSVKKSDTIPAGNISPILDDSEKTDDMDVVILTGQKKRPAPDETENSDGNSKGETKKRKRQHFTKKK